MSDADPALSIPELPALSRELGSLAFPLQRTLPLDDDPPFSLTGARAAIGGGCARGVNHVRAAGRPIMARLRLEGAIAASATLTPLGLERELRLADVGVVERAVVAQADPVAFFEWRPEVDRPIALTWDVPGEAVGAVGAAGAPVGGGPAAGIAPRWRAMGRGLVVEREGGRALYVLSRAPSKLVVEPAAGGGLRVRARLEPGGHSGSAGDPDAAGGSWSAAGGVRLGVAALVPGDDERRVLRVMGRSQVVVPSRRAAATRVLEERLSIDVPDASLARSLAWAAVRLEDRRTGGHLSPRELRLALASLALGDAAAARSLLAAADADSRGSGESGDREIPSDRTGSGDPDTAARQLVLTARYLAWTGDLRSVGAVWPTVRTRASALLVGLGADGDIELQRRALAGLVEAAEEVGDPELARRLRGAASTGGGRRPGVAGAGSGGPADTSLDPDPDPALDDSHAGHSGADAPGTAELMAGAALVEAVVEGLLGVAPDAPRGRLVLRPRLPRSWDQCMVRRLRVGEALVELELEREGGRHAFALRQVGGGSPIRVVFEPELDGDRLVSARVDGEPAELDAVAAEGRVRVPVQVVLDHERRVEVEIAGGGD